MLPDIYQLKQFLAVYRTGSYSAAAAQMNLSRQALTKNIRKVEQKLNGSLFVPQGKSLVPTSLAKALALHVQPVMEAWDTFSLRMQDVQNAKASSFTIALSHGVKTAMGISLTEEFRSLHPELLFSTEESNSDDVLSLVASSEAQVGILGSMPSFLQEFRWMLLRPSGMWLLMSMEHPLAECCELYPKDIKGFPIIGTGRHNHQHRYFVEECRKVGVEPTFFQMTTYPEASRLAPPDVDSLYFGFPDSIAPVPEGWIARPVRLPQAEQFGTYAIMSQTGRLPPGALKFWNYLKELVKTDN